MDIVTGEDLIMGYGDLVVGAPYGHDIVGDALDAVLGDGDDFAGNDLSLGADFLLGARGPREQAIRRAAIAQKALKAGTAVVQRRPHKARRFPLGITPTAVGVGVGLSINVQPQTYFRSERLFIPATIGPFFSIRDLKVGNVSQFPANVEVPAEIFSQTGVDTDIRLDTNDPAIFLSIDVLNISLAAATFRGAFIGMAVQ
jgi:hypothetical protein